MAEKEYIEREALLEDIEKEVVHGEWIPIEYDGYADGCPVWDLWECSECGEEHSGDEDTLTPYCPNCGAKMDGKGVATDTNDDCKKKGCDAE